MMQEIPAHKRHQNTLRRIVLVLGWGPLRPGGLPAERVEQARASMLRTSTGLPDAYHGRGPRGDRSHDPSLAEAACVSHVSGIASIGGPSQAGALVYEAAPRSSRWG